VLASYRFVWKLNASEMLGSPKIACFASQLHEVHEKVFDDDDGIDYGIIILLSLLLSIPAASPGGWLGGKGKREKGKTSLGYGPPFFCFLGGGW